MNNLVGKDVIKAVMESPLYLGMSKLERRTLIYRLMALINKSSGTQAQ